MPAASEDRGNDKNSKDMASPSMPDWQICFLHSIHCKNIVADLGLILTEKNNYEQHTICVDFKRHNWDPISFARLSLSLQKCSVIKS